MSLKDIKQALKDKAVAVLTRRAERLLARKIVLFPYLRVKWLLRKISFIEAQ